MKTTRLMAFTIVALLSMFLASAAQAQPGAFVSFKGIEVSTGHEEPGESYGWMCYARTTGSLPGNLTLSMNYDGTRAPGTTTTVTGGAWTLPVYEQSNFSAVRPIRIDSYQGVLFGSVAAGTVTWDKTGTTATVELKLLIGGGTQAMADLNGTAVLYGTLNYAQKGTATFNGNMYFEFK